MSELTRLALASLKAAVASSDGQQDPDFINAMEMTPAERLASGLRLSREAMATARYDLRKRRIRGDVFLL